MDNENIDADVRLYERIGKFIYGFHRTGATLDGLDAVAAAPGTPVALAQRAKQLRQDFDRLVKAMDTISDAECESTLREAAAVQALIAR